MYIRLLFIGKPTLIFLPKFFALAKSGLAIGARVVAFGKSVFAIGKPDLEKAAGTAAMA